jgi:choline-sulfatase
MIMADQLTPSALPFHGNAVTRTPAMSSLASSGVVFDAAYTASPLCSPARASLLTGMLPSRTGVYDNAAEFPASIPTFAHYLRSAGYRTVLAGKMHFCGPDQLHGFEERLTTDIYPADFGWTPDWDRPQDRPTWYHDMSSVTDAGPCLRSNQLDYDDEVAFAAERSLFGHIRSRDERPFCYVVSFTHPHDPYTIGHKWWDLYRDEDIPLPRPVPDDPHPHDLRLRAVCGMDGAPVTKDHVRAARRAYYGAISYVDDQIARLLAVLRETNRLDNTVVIVTSDHGDMLGDRGAWYKMSCYEPSARVPLIIWSPARFGPRRIAAPASTMDLLPTLLDLAGDGNREVPGPLDGRSLLPHLSGNPGRDETVAEYLAEGAIAPIVMIRKGRHKFVHSPADPDQLFDLAADLDERVNLAADPGSACLADEFRRQVAARWDLAGLDQQVRLSQRRRSAVSAALATGTETAWDFTPAYDASRRYIRNHLDLPHLERMARFPPVH